MPMSSGKTFPRALPYMQSSIPFLLFVFTMAFLYVFSPVEMSDNGAGYLDKARSGNEIFYPPHLLHVPIIRAIYLVLSDVAACDVTCAGLAHSMFWASVTVVSVYAIVLGVLGTIRGALLTAMMVLVSHSFWVYATQAEVYVPAVGCTTAATALLLTNRRRTLPFGRLCLVAILWALATTYHLPNVLLFIPFSIFFLNFQGLKGVRQLAILSALAGSAVLMTFVSVYWWENSGFSVDDFVAWAFSITSVPMTDWGSLSNFWEPRDLFEAASAQLITVTLVPEYLTYAQEPLMTIGVVIAAAFIWNIVEVIRGNPLIGPDCIFLHCSPRTLHSFFGGNPALTNSTSRL